MVTDSNLNWEDAVHEFLLHLEATRAANTHRFYKTQLRQLVAWATENAVPFAEFGKRHLDRFLAERLRAGSSQTTLHHDALIAKAFFRWCQKNDLVERSLLAEYQIRKAPLPARYMPTDEEMRGLLRAVPDYWNPEKNPAAKYSPLNKRIFHRDRNYAIVLGLLDTACRIGEMLSLKREDYRANERQILVRESKGREPRVIPISAEWARAVEDWLRVRARIMADVPAGQDAGWLFISEFGGRVDEKHFLKAVQRATKKAGLSESITLHSLRRYSLNKLAKHNLLAAQTIAGHKETKTTLLYTKLDPDFIRDMHTEVGVLRGIVVNGRVEREKRKRLL